MEIILGLAAILVVFVIARSIMRHSDERAFQRAQAVERIRIRQEQRLREVTAEYERNRASRSAPVTTGKPATKASPRSSGGSGSSELKRHDNSFDNVVDTYSAPAYTPSHSSSSYSSCSSSSSSSSDSSSSSSSSSSCD